MRTVDKLKQDIRETGMPEKKQGHLTELLSAMKNGERELVALSCFMQNGCLMCCAEESGKEECWIEWCNA